MEKTHVYFILDIDKLYMNEYWICPIWISIEIPSEVPPFCLWLRIEWINRENKEKDGRIISD